MGEGEQDRLIAWNRELTAAHQRLRQALSVVREALDAGNAGDLGNAGDFENPTNTTTTAAAVRAEPLLYCHGFCAALSGHHAGEDTALFPELAARHPELRSTIAKLRQDHEMIASLLARFDDALNTGAPPGELSLHLDGLSAIMESHFQYEERSLLDLLSRLELHADLRDVLGPL